MAGRGHSSSLVYSGPFVCSHGPPALRGWCLTLGQMLLKFLSRTHYMVCITSCCYPPTHLFNPLPRKHLRNKIPQIKTIHGGTDQFLPIFYGLQVLLLAFLGLILFLQIRLNGFVLSIEVAQILRKRERKGSDSPFTPLFSSPPYFLVCAEILKGEKVTVSRVGRKSLLHLLGKPPNPLCP